MNNSIKSVSIIVPAFNEEANLKNLIERIDSSLTSSGIKYEIIIVDDHSTDKTISVIKNLAIYYPIILTQKVGKKGKAFSIIQGVKYAQYENIAMIDADLQYPPEALPKMIKMLLVADVVVANRKIYEDSKIRKLFNKSFRFVFGKTLFGLNHDVQSGLKVFTREVFDTIGFHPSSSWTFDLEFLHRANQAGFVIKDFDIKFSKRESGNSKVKFFNVIPEVGLNALAVRLKRIHPVTINPSNHGSMIGAGIGHKRNRYITHTTIPHHLSALKTFTKIQKLIFLLILIGIGAGLFVNPLLTLKLLIAGLSFIYFLDVIFNFYLISKSLSFPREIISTPEELENIDNKILPIYTILCPLYKEAPIIPQFLKAIEKISWPKEKLDVILLLEEDDKATIHAASKMNLPSYVRILVVPHSVPKTKPKACNYGLSFAKGEFVVIFDAEDVPDPLQLKKAYLGFKKSPEDTICLQARLNYYNPHQNLLTRFFTAEYSLWFDVTLPGLVAIETALPLGGTSNHFKTYALKSVHGWDPFNVTEDADLGVRLFKKGYKTAMIDSTTLEEANSNVKNWFRQRSRWIKGYMQTYLVHTRRSNESAKIHRKHSLFFQLVVGGKIAFVLINPILWILTIAYFALYSYVGPTIEALYPNIVFYMAIFSLVVGNFLFLYYYMIGLAKKGQWNLIKYVFLVPIYWFMISISAFIALYQLIFKPHYWEKTVHGLHLKKTVNKTIEGENVISEIPIANFENKKKFKFPSLKKVTLSLSLSLVFIAGLIIVFQENFYKAVSIGGIVFGFYLILTEIIPILLRISSTLVFNIKDFLNIFQRTEKPKQDGIKILMFNWRDTKHKWAGGAEVYAHELAKRWVKEGNYVTMFVGSDRKSKRNDVIDGVNIIRRGGFYSVYLWAFIYFIFKLRGKYDVIIDTENGIPFFTPLYTRKKKFLLIHHVHQEVFRKSLKWPLSSIALFLEAKLMPIVYRNVQVITVSPSSKQEILKHKLTKTDPIVIYNGVDLTLYRPGAKSDKPLIIYLGRLQYYKSLHIFIVAAKRILKKMPDAQFIIAGEGGEKEKLIEFAKRIGIENKIQFVGRVTEREKINLFKKAWVFVNPSFMEGWGITTIEANACGTPVVASNVIGLKDSIKDKETGLLVRYRDYDGFTKNINSIIKNKRMRKKMSRSAYIWSKNFSWDSSADKFLSVIKSSVEEKTEIEYLENVFSFQN